MLLQVCVRTCSYCPQVSVRLCISSLFVYGLIRNRCIGTAYQLNSIHKVSYQLKPSSKSEVSDYLSFIYLSIYLNFIFP